MAVALAKDSIDVGIVVADADKALAFYRDLLGFELQATVQMGDFITQYRLGCGSSVVDRRRCDSTGLHQKSHVVAATRPGSRIGMPSARSASVSVSPRS